MAHSTGTEEGIVQVGPRRWELRQEHHAGYSIQRLSIPVIIQPMTFYFVFTSFAQPAAHGLWCCVLPITVQKDPRRCDPRQLPARHPPSGRLKEIMGQWRGGGEGGKGLPAAEQLRGGADF